MCQIRLQLGRVHPRGDEVLPWPVEVLCRLVEAYPRLALIASLVLVVPVVLKSPRFCRTVCGGDIAGRDGIRGTAGPCVLRGTRAG